MGPDGSFCNYCLYANDQISFVTAGSVSRTMHLQPSSSTYEPIWCTDNLSPFILTISFH
jgi:hypothetical protein